MRTRVPPDETFPRRTKSLAESYGIRLEEMDRRIAESMALSVCGVRIKCMEGAK
jgi:hypothetical protein